MKTLRLISAGLIAALLSFTFTACSDDDDDKPEVKLALSGLDAPFDSEEGSVLLAQELNIKCNTEWEITGKPEWLDISQLDGEGDATVKIWTNSANKSANERSATLAVKAGDLVKEKTVIQRSSYKSSCNVEPNVIVTLADGVAFDYTFGPEVSYYYSDLWEASLLERITDEEIVAVMIQDVANRDTPNDNYITSWTNLDPQTEYVACMVGFDKSGKQGQLSKTTIKTKKATNQPIVYINEIDFDDTYWYWDTEVNGYVTKYYQWVINYDDLHAASDVAIAWFFMDEMKANPNSFTPIVQSSSWSAKRNGSDIFDVATWGVDIDGNFSGVMNRVVGQISSEAKMKRMPTLFREKMERSKIYKN